MKTSGSTYKTLFLVLFCLPVFYLLPGYVQITTGNFNPFQIIKFDSAQECCENFITAASDNLNLPAHNLSKRTGTPHYFIIYDLSNDLIPDTDLTGMNFSDTELNPDQNDFYINSESRSRQLPFEKALRSDILLI